MTNQIISILRIFTVAAIAVSALDLAGCGNGGGGSTPSAAASTANPTANPVAASNPTGLTTGPSNPTSTQAAAAVLPLEVLGVDGSVVTVSVSAPNGSAATRLWLQANNLSYDAKGSVKVNNGPWVDLTNANVAIEGGGRYYGGIGGGFDTLKMSVPVSGAVNGANLVSFRFNKTDGITSGYRVLAFNLLDASGNQMVGSTNFTEDDPTRWTPPLSSAADIAAGKQLWQSAQLVESPINVGHVLKAHCMDCHAADGSDLQRFNYSNYAIAVRAQFHGLTSGQGQQIASYIRNLNNTLGVPGPHCRPWNPPYQPGPGLDAGDVRNWTCGAGLESVSDNDLDTLNTVFPNGISKDAIATGSHLNAREIPISLQLPDWNHWVPHVHPKDAWGDYFTNSNLNKKYAGEGTGNSTYNMRTQLAAGGAAYATGHTGDIFNDLYYWGNELGADFTPPNEGTSGAYTIAQQQNLYATAQWQLLKSWEIAQDFNLEAQCPQAWAAHSGTKVEPRVWCGYWRFVFNVSPHILGFPVNNSMFGSPVADLTKANQWYEMQLLLNPGNGAHLVHLPLDWQYAYGLFDDLSAASGRTEPARKLVYVVKGAQEMDNGVGVTDVNRGWTTRDTSPMDVWDFGQSGIWKGVAPATEQAVVNAFLTTWLDRTTSFDVSQWQRLGANPAAGEVGCGWSIRSLCWSNYVPGTLQGPTPTVANFPSWAFTRIPLMRGEGVDGSQLNRFANWMNTAYPSGNFTSLVK